MSNNIPEELELEAIRMAEDCVEFGEVNTTRLAENLAHHFGHDEWLDDSDHPVWEAALFAESYHLSRLDN